MDVFKIDQSMGGLGSGSHVTESASRHHQVTTEVSFDTTSDFNLSFFDSSSTPPTPPQQQQQQQQQDLAEQRYSQYLQQMRPMVQPPAPQQVDRVTPQRQISGGPVSDQVRPMVQPTPPQQQAERAIPQIAGAPLNPMERYQKMMRQQQQQRMGEISGNPYSQQLGQEDRRMEAMRKMQQMNLGG